jgi:hypothetical protein
MTDIYRFTLVHVLASCAVSLDVRLAIRTQNYAFRQLLGGSVILVGLSLLLGRRV